MTPLRNAFVRLTLRYLDAGASRDEVRRALEQIATVLLTSDESQLRDNLQKELGP